MALNTGCGVTCKARRTSITQGLTMRFLVTMNMPSFNNNLVHQVNVEHANSNSLEDLLLALTVNDFVLVEEFYQDPTHWN